MNAVMGSNRTAGNKWSTWVRGARGLTERSCVCGLGEIFWHFPVDIESAEREGRKKRNREQKQRERGVRGWGWGEYIEERGHSVPVRPRDYYRTLVEC